MIKPRYQPLSGPARLCLGSRAKRFVGASCLLVLFSPASQAANRQGRSATNDLVDQALRAEIAGNDEARLESLSQAVAAQPDDPRARWAAGFVKHEGQWLSFSALPGDAKHADLLAEYRRHRERLPDTMAGHQELANWCHQHGLKEQERAHLARALDFEPDRDDLRKRLGMVQVNGVWLGPREASEAAKLARKAQADFRRWRPRAERLRAALDAPGPRREAALAQIRAVRDPAAVWAFEVIVAPVDDDAGSAVAEALSYISTPEAALSLARLASFSDSADTVDAAREKLKSKPADSYIPAMLSVLTSPGETQTSIVADWRGNFLFRQAFQSEGADRKRLAVFDDVYLALNGRNPESQLVASTLGSAVVSQRSRISGFLSRLAERINQRICETLRYVTGQDLPPDPKCWWQWWNEYNEIALSAAKPTQYVYVRSNTPLVGRTRNSSYHSCLVAGTPIWTDQGPEAVEQIRVGDRVLAQDPDTGELAYRSVVRTTVRDRSALVDVRLPDETIVATGGHPFWVAGRGWLIARRLEAGMLLHGVNGATRIESVHSEPEGDRPVYNLVVEDFHNYFVGKSRVLLHDITPRQPTRGPLPGLYDAPNSPGTP